MLPRPGRTGLAALCVSTLLVAACSSNNGGAAETTTSTTQAATDTSSLATTESSTTATSTTDPSTTTIAVGQNAASASECVDTTESSQDPQVAEILAAVQKSMAEQKLQAVTLTIQRDDYEVLTAALGETVEGVPATPDMRFWNGAIVFTYLGTMMLQLADEGVLDIDEPIAEYLPDVPEADAITPRMLMASMSGYPDYVTQDAFVEELYADPFTAFTQDELEAFVFSEPLYFEPGTNVSYSHLNFRLAGMVIEEATGQELADVLNQRIIEPLRLKETDVLLTADIPSPRLYTFTDERGNYEDSSLWSPAWGVPDGATMATTVCDVATAGTAVGSGALISEESFEILVNPGTAAVGQRTEECPTCIPMSDELHLGMGVTVAGDWIIQTPLFTGISGVQAYLPSENLSVAIASTFGQGADVGSNGSTEIFRTLIPVLTPDSNFPQF